MHTEDRELGQLTVSVEDAWRHEIGDRVMLEVPVFYHTDGGVVASAVWIGGEEIEEIAVAEARYWASNIERSRS
jgi:hypothetical protein